MFVEDHAVSMTCGLSPEIVNIALEYLNFLILQSEQTGINTPIVVVAHSEGAMIAEHVVRQMELSKRKKIQFWTLGGAGFVPNGICHQNTCNFIKQYDAISRAISPIDYRILIIRDQFCEENLDFVANFLAKEDLIIEGLDESLAHEFWERERTQKYRKRLDELCNTSIIYHEKESGVQHGFDDHHYQAKLRELIDNLYDQK